ncbi:MAG: FAD-binding protein [Bacteriovoracaceae bacterium]|nr:FAD-binding protein [Bacteriovoracaceae bacterium]
MRIQKTDCLVIGTGMAGSIFAHEAMDKKFKTILVTGSENLNESNSYYAQGGIIYDREPEHKLLIEDVLKASNYTADAQVVKEVVTFGAKFLKEILIDKLGVPFDRDQKGELLFTKEGAHSQENIVYCKDTTGRNLIEKIHEKIKVSPNLEIKPHLMAIDLITLSHSSKNIADKYKPLTCMGAYFLDTKTQEVVAILAKETILATGGVGQLYLNTTNAKEAFGHGIVMAQRVGARIMDMEYVQFHPTAFHAKSGDRSFLISEAVRGEGAQVVDAHGKTFMHKYHELGSLAPRDILSRSMNLEMLETGSSCMYLDLSPMKKNPKERFPNIYIECLKHGIDITRDLIPVAPAAHYLCGGIHSNLAGETNITGLKVIGESACTGLHGSNRLASTSLLECLVMGKLCVEKIAENFKSQKEFIFPEIKEWEMARELPDDKLILQDLALIKNTMWNYVGLMRSTKRLERARKILSELKAEVREFYANCKLTPELLHLRSAIQCSELITYAASRNKESSGCHFRED